MQEELPGGLLGLLSTMAVVVAGVKLLMEVLSLSTPTKCLIAVEGFGLVLDGTEDAARRAKNFLFWDVNNGISRRAWAGNSNAVSFTCQKRGE